MEADNSAMGRQVCWSFTKGISQQDMGWPEGKVDDGRGIEESIGLAVVTA